MTRYFRLFGVGLAGLSAGLLVIGLLAVPPRLILADDPPGTGTPPASCQPPDGDLCPDKITFSQCLAAGCNGNGNACDCVWNLLNEVKCACP